MSTGALMKKARSYEAAKALRNRAPRIKGSIGRRNELKYVDTASATYVGDTTGTVTLINGVAVGDDNTTRDGRQITLKSVQVRGSFQNVDATSGASMCRLLLVWDNAANGSLATITQILSASTSNSFPNVDNSNRFTILSDTQYVVGPYVNTATQAIAPSPGVAAVNIYKKLNSITQYSSTTSDIASIQNGALLMVTIGDQAVGGGGLFFMAARCRFTDD